MKLFVYLLILLSLLSLNAESIAFLGVSTSNIDYDKYIDYGIEDGYGILIDFVAPNTAADKSGIKEGMILRTYNQEKVYTRKQLSRMIQNSKPDQEVSITVLCDGKEKSFKVSLGQKEEKISYPWMGVNLDDDFQIDDFAEPYGLIIKRVVEDSPAQRSGLMKDDILLSIDTQKLYSKDQVSPMLRNYQPGDEISLKYWRNGKEYSTKLTLGKIDNPDENFWELDTLLEGFDLAEELFDLYDIWNSVGFPHKVHVLAYQDSSNKILGVIVSEVGKTKKDQLKIQSGLVVDKVIPETPADSGGIKEGDVILDINGIKVVEFDDIAKILDAIEIDSKFSVNILRNDKKHKLTLTMEKVSLDIWEKYYSNLLENDIIRVITDKEKPLDLYFESLDDLDIKINPNIELEIETKEDIDRAM